MREKVSHDKIRGKDFITVLLSFRVILMHLVDYSRKQFPATSLSLTRMSPEENKPLR